MEYYYHVYMVYDTMTGHVKKNSLYNSCSSTVLTDFNLLLCVINNFIKVCEISYVSGIDRMESTNKEEVSLYKTSASGVWAFSQLKAICEGNAEDMLGSPIFSVKNNIYSSDVASAKQV